MASEDLSLLIKLLKVTTSSSDGEALVAMRKANEQLMKLKTDWESLLRGKVTIIEDPFKSTSTPTSDKVRKTHNTPRAAPPPPPPAPGQFRRSPGWVHPPPQPRRATVQNTWTLFRVPNPAPRAPDPLAAKVKQSRSSRRTNPITINDLI